MIIQQLIKRDGETIEVIRDNVTDIYESDDKIEVTFSRPNGELNLVTIEKAPPSNLQHVVIERQF